MKLKQLVPDSILEMRDGIMDHFQNRADRINTDLSIENFRNHLRFIEKTGTSTFLNSNGKTEMGHPNGGAKRLYFWSKTTTEPHQFDHNEIIQRLKDTVELTKLQNHVRKSTGGALTIQPYCSETTPLVIGFQARAESVDAFKTAIEKLRATEPGIEQEFKL